MRNFIVISCICALLTLGTILKRYSRDWPSIIFKKYQIFLDHCLFKSNSMISLEVSPMVPVIASATLYFNYSFFDESSHYKVGY